MDQTIMPEDRVGPLTLAIDIGGTRLKAGILASTGRMVAGPERVDTPHPSPPAVVVEALVGLTPTLGDRRVVVALDPHHLGAARPDRRFFFCAGEFGQEDH